MLRKNGLLDSINDAAVTDPVIVAVTFDGGEISRFFSHVTGGFKLVDRRCKGPRTEGLLFGDNGIDKVQSHVHCFPIKVCFAKDTKQLYKIEFEEFFAFLKAFEMEKEGRMYSKAF